MLFFACLRDLRDLRVSLRSRPVTRLLEAKASCDGRVLEPIDAKNNEDSHRRDQGSASKPAAGKCSVTRVLVHAVQELRTRGDTAKSHQQNLHLGEYQVGRDQLPPLLEPTAIRRDRGLRYDSASAPSWSIAVPSGASISPRLSRNCNIRPTPCCSFAKLRTPRRKISAFDSPVSEVSRFRRSRSSAARYTCTGSRTRRGGVKIHVKNLHYCMYALHALHRDPKNGSAIFSWCFSSRAFAIFADFARTDDPAQTRRSPERADRAAALSVGSRSTAKETTRR